jgi:hypothetical protein
MLLFIVLLLVVIVVFLCAISAMMWGIQETLARMLLTLEDLADRACANPECPRCGAEGKEK